MSREGVVSLRAKNNRVCGLCARRSLAILLTYRAAVGRPLSPTDTLAIYGYLAVIAFVISASAAWLLEHRQVKALEQQFYDREMEVKAKKPHDQNVPTGLRRAALEFQAQTPHGLTQGSAGQLAELVDYAVERLDPDSLYIMAREMFAESFGPFDVQRGRYGGLLWSDLRERMDKLQDLEIVETATGDDGVSRYHWTVFGHAVIGRLAPKLKNIK